MHLGEFINTDLIPSDRRLESIVPDCIVDKDVELFLDFMRKMLCWLPEDRATAEELQAMHRLRLDDMSQQEKHRACFNAKVGV